MNRRSKLFILLLAATLLFCLFAPTALAASANCCEVTIGGVRNYTEAFNMLPLVNDLRDSTPVNEKALDVNGDDRTDILDIIRLIRWLADKSISLK